jgi:hypothetical protein
MRWCKLTAGVAALMIAASLLIRGKQSDPTDPEVPDAKRKRAVRRRRSVLLTGTIVAALVLTVGLLLYKIGLQLADTPVDGYTGDHGAPSSGAPGSRSASLPPPLGAPATKQSTAPAEPSSEPVENSTTSTRPAGAPPRAKANDIIREPNF